MATESFVNVTEGSGKKLHTNQRTIGANTVEDEYILHGEYPGPSYIAQATSASAATANDHMIQLMAPAGSAVRIRRIDFWSAGLATTAAISLFDLIRLTTAGTGGTAITARPFDTADAAFGGDVRQVPGVKGTEGVTLRRFRYMSVQTVPTAGGPIPGWSWEEDHRTPPIIIPSGTANGICVKNLAAYAGLQVDLAIEFVVLGY